MLVLKKGLSLVVFQEKKRGAGLRGKEFVLSRPRQRERETIFRATAKRRWKRASSRARNRRCQYLRPKERGIPSGKPHGSEVSGRKAQHGLAVWVESPTVTGALRKSIT